MVVIYGLFFILISSENNNIHWHSVGLGTHPFFIALINKNTYLCVFNNSSLDCLLNGLHKRQAIWHGHMHVKPDDIQ